MDLDHLQPEYFILNHQFENFDEFAATIQTWDLEFRQLDRGPSKPNLFQIIGPHVAFSYACFNRHYHQLGTTPPGMRTFGLLEDSVSGIHWFKRDISAPSTSLLCFPNTNELEAVSRSDFKVYTFSFSEHLLAQTADTLGLPDINSILSNNDQVMNCSPQTTQEIRSLLRLIRSRAQYAQSHNNHFELKRLLEDELPSLILTAITHTQSTILNSPMTWKKQQALNKSKEYINSNPYDPISVNQLCQVTGVSMRTLESAFKEYYGVVPKKYLTATRLNGVYKEILNQESSFFSITDIANKWGFWHMGQFSADYKRLFNQLPSTTFAQRRTVSFSK